MEHKTKLQLAAGAAILGALAFLGTKVKPVRRRAARLARSGFGRARSYYTRARSAYARRRRRR